MYNVDVSVNPCVDNDRVMYSADYLHKQTNLCILNITIHSTLIVMNQRLIYHSKLPLYTPINLSKISRLPCNKCNHLYEFSNVT
jgi:hypothetical protein